MDDSVKKQALILNEEGECEALYELLKPYIKAEDIFALNLYANFSLLSFNESEEQFARRNIKLKTLASEGGIAEASYRMGVNHLYGDDVEQSYGIASMYFQRAIKQGHSYTKFTYGFSLYHGTDRNIKNEELGLTLMTEAASEGVELAIDELEKLNHA